MPAGYSGTPLAQKLGIKPQMRISVLGFGSDYGSLTHPLPIGVTVTTRVARGARFIHLFTRSRSELEHRFPTLARNLADEGMLWVSWPKQASGVATDLTEAVVRTIGLATGLVDVKVCAVDSVWSGLKFVRRVRDRAPR